MPGLLDQLVIVRSTSVGKNWKDVVNTGYRHPFLKSGVQWKMPDRFLASLGKYWTTTLTGKFERMAPPGQRSFQYFDPLNGGGTILDVIGNPDIGDVLELERIGEGPLPNAGPGLPQIMGPPGRWTIEYDRQVWNLYNSSYKNDPGVDDLLDKILAGDPFYEWYLKDGMNTLKIPGTGPQSFRMASAGLPALIDTGAQFNDRTLQLYLPVQNNMGDSALNVEATPIYNYYIGTGLAAANSYESVIADLPEAAIPNFYMLHHSLAPSGDPIDRYQNQITFNGNVGYFDVPIANMEQYFSSYVTALKALKTAHDENLVPKTHPDYAPSNWTEALAALVPQGKYLGIYSENLSILEGLSTIPVEERVESSISDMPIYVDLKIDHNQLLDVQGPPSIATTRPSMTIAQLLKENNLYDMMLSMIVQLQIGTRSDEAALSTYEYTMAIDRSTKITTTEGEIFTNLPTQILSNQALGTKWIPGWQGAIMGQDYFSLTGLEFDRMIDEPWVLAPKLSLGTNLIDPVNLANVGSTPGLTIPSGIEPMDISSVDGQFFDFFTGGPGTNISAFEFFLSTLKGDVGIMNLESNYTETFMYKVEKRVVESGAFIPLDQLDDREDPDGALLYPVVQTFYIAIDPEQVEKTMRYIDTQVKYGVIYQYNFTQIRFINSTLYGYQDLQVHTDYEGDGRALGNALGFYLDADLIIPSGMDFWEYVPWGRDTPVATEQVGHFVLPYNAQQIAAPVSSNLSKHMMRLKDGYGFDSNINGGAITVGEGSADMPLDQQRSPPGLEGFGAPGLRGVTPFAGGKGPPEEEANRLLDLVSEAGEMQGEKLLDDMLGGRGLPTGGGFSFGGLDPDIAMDWSPGGFGGPSTRPGSPSGMTGGQIYGEERSLFLDTHSSADQRAGEMESRGGAALEALGPLFDEGILS